MANKRQLVKRRKAVRNIRKITRTMQLIATARFQATFRRATAGKPYGDKLTELVNILSGIDVELEDSLLEPHSDVPRDALIILTSNRGLCGGYNANVLRAAMEHLTRHNQKNVPCDVYMVGKKGINYFRFLKKPVKKALRDFPDTPRFDRVEGLADDLMEQFRKGELTSVHVAYMRFYSAGRQRPDVAPLLPLATSVVEGPEAGSPPAGQAEVVYDFSPDPKQLLEELLPATVRLRLFQYFMDGTVSEQVARMVAMKAATDAAGDMISLLTRRYNRARQTSITMELLDIIGGAGAVD